MIWADKLGILWGFLVLTYIDILVKQPLVEDPGFALTIVMKLVLPVWAVFRLIDWVMAGPRRRQLARS